MCSYTFVKAEGPYFSDFRVCSNGRSFGKQLQTGRSGLETQDTESFSRRGFARNSRGIRRLKSDYGGFLHSGLFWAGGNSTPSLFWTDSFPLPFWT